MLFAKHQNTLNNAVKANHDRTFYAQYPEHPKAYGEEAPQRGEAAFKGMLGHPFERLLQESDNWEGEEVSPYTLEPLGISYPIVPADALVMQAAAAGKQWAKTPVADRAALLTETLDAIKEHFFEIAYATMHTTGQSYMMSFQASGPHANDRALEAIALGYQELQRYPEQLTWEKPMGKISVKLDKHFKAIPKGIGLVIGCSTFPVWNSLPGIYANLVTGNAVLVKPHPKAVLPIAIAVAAIQQVLQHNGYDPLLCQLAADTSAHLNTKELCEHPEVTLIDYTGGSAFGNYVEQLPGKTVFTEKAGVNSVIIDSAPDMDAVAQNLAFAVSLYSGQMCTAPQNFFIPDHLYDEVAGKIKNAVEGLVNHPKMGAGTLGAVQSEVTLKRAHEAASLGKVLLGGGPVTNEEFANARTCSPTILEVNASDEATYDKELFGPVILLIRTKDTAESIRLAQAMARKHGAITCAAYSTSEQVQADIEEAMNSVFTPVSFNFTGPIWVNQHAAFSDFHVTGGNAAGNASFTNPEFVLKRFVWVGNRKQVN